MKFGVYFCLCDIQNCSHTFFFLDPVAFFLKISPSFSSSYLHSHLFLFHVCQVFTLLERVTTLTSVSQLAGKEPHLLEPQPI